MKTNHLFIILFVASFWVSCQKDDNTNTDGDSIENSVENSAESSAESRTSLGALEQEILVLQDSILSFRNQAFALEEEKINSTAALIEEVENVVAGYDPSAISALKQSLNKVQELRYNNETLGDETVMLTYDEACDALLADLNNLANDTEDFNRYVRANLLIKDIIEANNQDLFVRKEYNFYVEAYNKKVSENSSKISNPDISVNKFPLFYGGPPS